MEEALENAEEGIDTRPGSIYYDAVAGIALRIAKMYCDLDMLIDLFSLDTAPGSFLDEKASNYNVFRSPARACKYNVEFIGTQPEVGERFFQDGIYFELKKMEDGIYFLEAEKGGIAANKIYAETLAVPLNNIDGLVSAKFGKILEYGTEEEDDESLRNRVREKIAGPAENGNKQHYKTWCEEVEGVGRARIHSLWKGENTVKGVLISPTGLPVNNIVVERVQNYIDPDFDGDGEGDGLGEGVGTIGSHFTAIAAVGVTITVSVKVLIKENASLAVVKEEVKSILEKLFQEIALSSEKIRFVRYVTIGSLITNIPGMLDYSEFTLNGEEKNVEILFDEVPVLGEVVVYAE